MWSQRLPDLEFTYTLILRKFNLISLNKKKDTVSYVVNINENCELNCCGWVDRFWAPKGNVPLQPTMCHIFNNTVIWCSNGPNKIHLFTVQDQTNLSIISNKWQYITMCSIWNRQCISMNFSPLYTYFLTLLLLRSHS